MQVSPAARQVRTFEAGMGPEVAATSRNENVGCDVKTNEDFHFRIKTIIHYQAVCQPDSMLLHGVPCRICIISNVDIIEIIHALRRRLSMIRLIDRRIVLDYVIVVVRHS